jgi:SAM-dependent methyltransferase
MITDKFGDLSVFDEIYATSYWGNGSGGGSSLDATIPYKNFLENFVRSRAIKSVVDLGCGDWQFSQFVDFADATYNGFDVAKSVIDENRKKYSSQKIEFSLLQDYSNLPSADLFICKDVLQHLSTEEILKVLGVLPNYKYALITNDIVNMSKIGKFLWKIKNPSSEPLINRDIKTGDYRTLDPTLQPFFLKASVAFQWKVNKLGFRDRFRKHNLIYGVDCECKKRTYLYTSDRK